MKAVATASAVPKTTAAAAPTTRPVIDSQTGIPSKAKSKTGEEAARPEQRLEVAAIKKIKNSVRLGLASPAAAQSSSIRTSSTKRASSGAESTMAAPIRSSSTTEAASDTRGTTRQLLMDGFLADMFRSIAVGSTQAEGHEDSMTRLDAQANADGAASTALNAVAPGGTVDASDEEGWMLQRQQRRRLDKMNSGSSDSGSDGSLIPRGQTRREATTEGERRSRALGRNVGEEAADLRRARDLRVLRGQPPLRSPRSSGSSNQGKAVSKKAARTFRPTGGRKY